MPARHALSRPQNYKPPNLLAHYLYLGKTTVVPEAIETARTSVSSGGHSSMYWYQQDSVFCSIRGRTKKGYFWVLARDDRPWCGRAPPAVVYSYAPGRGGDHAAALLKGYSGVLQTDGYAGYRSLADPKRAGGPATLAFCWAHWRRQWF